MHSGQAVQDPAGRPLSSGDHGWRELVAEGGEGEGERGWRGWDEITQDGETDRALPKHDHLYILQVEMPESGTMRDQ